LGKYDRVLRKIAKKNNVSVRQVKREIEAAIIETYKNPNPKAMSIPREGEIPTIEEFMDQVIKECGEYKL